MDIQELLSEIQESMDTVETELNNARDSAAEASSSAQEAYQYASNAEDEAGAAFSRAEDGLEALGTLREEFAQLQEQVEELLHGEETGEGVSSLQKDINKWKTKVLHVRANNPSISAEKIAAHLEIGEFLVSRILELEQQAA